MKILTFDLETAPNIGDAWQLWNTTISLNQLRQSAYTLCWAAKWYGQKKMYFGSVWDGTITDIRKLLEEADATVTYNGNNFDIKILNKDLALGGWGPVSPYQSIDLLKVVKSQFRFPSNKLEYVAQQFEVGAKVKHSGHDLWVRVMAGDPKAQKEMQKYCQNDVVITEALYERLLPWIPSHPNRNLYEETEGCGKCGGELRKRGFFYGATGRYQTYRCTSCGGWSRDVRRSDGTDRRSI